MKKIQYAFSFLLLLYRKLAPWTLSDSRPWPKAFNFRVQSNDGQWKQARHEKELRWKWTQWEPGTEAYIDSLLGFRAVMAKKTSYNEALD